MIPTLEKMNSRSHGAGPGTQQALREHSLWLLLPLQSSCLSLPASAMTRQLTSRAIVFKWCVLSWEMPHGAGLPPIPTRSFPGLLTAGLTLTSDP